MVVTDPNHTFDLDHALAEGAHACAFPKQLLLCALIFFHPFTFGRCGFTLACSFFTC